MSLPDKIMQRAKRAGADWVFTRSDLLDLGSTHAIGMAIQRLLKAGKLRRIGRGLYDVPRMHPELGELSATSDAIAAAIARRDGIRLQTTEAGAANLLNLSEQVPARIAYPMKAMTATISAVHAASAAMRAGSPAAMPPARGSLTSAPRRSTANSPSAR